MESSCLAAALNDMIREIPVIDFGNFDSNPKEVAQKVLEACKTIGFFYIVNHGLASDQVDHSFELVISLSSAKGQ